jgi:hypothetical protein
MSALSRQWPTCLVLIIITNVIHNRFFLCSQIVFNLRFEIRYVDKATNWISSTYVVHHLQAKLCTQTLLCFSPPPCCFGWTLSAACEYSSVAKYSRRWIFFLLFLEHRWEHDLKKEKGNSQCVSFTVWINSRQRQLKRTFTLKSKKANATILSMAE